MSVSPALPVQMYATRWCGYCERARMLLARKGVDWVEIDVAADAAQRAEMIARCGKHTVPQIWIGATHVGGCDELYALERSGDLDRLLDGEIIPD